ncbi:hypothetical protein NW762_014773 [Fusarium torreyae]|uniref:Uncharacterized protein n=1 Tax=Fusarium torreyae TaxID=1237075 RepID=A0A9W8RM57_9HYPO|nr:hypothetical protein NW762_014773 [Fusarium torreyae]
MPHKVETNGRDAQSMLARDGSVASAQENQQKVQPEPKKVGHMLTAWVNETRREHLSINEVLLQRTGSQNQEP